MVRERELIRIEYYPPGPLMFCIKHQQSQIDPGLLRESVSDHIQIAF